MFARKSTLRQTSNASGRGRLTIRLIIATASLSAEASKVTRRSRTGIADARACRAQPRRLVAAVTQRLAAVMRRLKKGTVADRNNRRIEGDVSNDERNNVISANGSDVVGGAACAGIDIRRSGDRPGSRDFFNRRG